MIQYWQLKSICHGHPGQRAAAHSCRFTRFAWTAPWKVASLSFALATICFAASPARLAEVEDEHPPDAIEVFRCNFDESWDANYDLWPDRWVRQAGIDYPNYVDVQISDDVDL